MCKVCCKDLGYMEGRNLTPEEAIKVEEVVSVINPLNFLACKACGLVYVKDVAGELHMTAEANFAFIKMAAKTFTDTPVVSYALDSEGPKIPLDPDSHAKEDAKIAAEVSDSVHEVNLNDVMPGVGNTYVDPSQVSIVYGDEEPPKEGFVKKVLRKIKGLFS